MSMTTTRAALALAALLAPAALAAQVANPLPRAVGMANSYTAVARGIAAPAWNPAGLGMPDNPEFSLAVLPVHAASGIEPIDFGHFAEFEGQFVPAEAREEWLTLIAEHGGEKGTFGADIALAAVSVGSVAFSATNSIRSRVNVAPDVAEVLLFGNAGRYGVPQAYTLEGSSLDVSATTTFAASAAIPVALTLGPLPDQHFAVGATLKYTVANFLFLAQEAGSSVTSDPLAVDVAFPVISSPLPDSTEEWSLSEHGLDNGSGIGLDIGAAWQGGIFGAGLVVKNLFNTFEWDLDRLEYREHRATWDADNAETSFDESPIDGAPREILERVDQLYTFSPVLAAGASARVMPGLLLTADVRHALDDNLDIGVQNHIGVGAEITALPVLPIRAGLALVSGGYQLSGGLGLVLGPVQLSASGAYRDGELGDDALGAFALTFGI